MKINQALAESIKQIREKSLPSREHTRKVIHWEEKHYLRSGLGKALVFILPTKGCSWALSKSGGCSICGYIYDNPQETDFTMIVDSVKEILNKKLGEEEKYSVKLFTSGSFLDKRELPLAVQASILKEISKYKRVEEVVLESRPEYVTQEALHNLKDVLEKNKIEIAIGLESSNNKILKNSINKGFFWEDYEKAVERVFEFGAKVKTYLLFKPPFISEYDSMIDILRSVSDINKIGGDIVSINAISIHRGTFLSQLFEKKVYRPPWLWSLHHICRVIKSTFPHLRVICDIVAGGKEKGAHNCANCDQDVLDSIKRFTQTQKVSELEDIIQCSCKEEWKSVVLSEKISISDVSYNIQFS